MIPKSGLRFSDMRKQTPGAGLRFKGKSSPSSPPSEFYVQSRDRFEIVDRVVFDHRHADLERHGDGLLHVAPNHEIHRQEQSAGLPGDWVSVVDADVGVWIERDKPAAAG